MVNTLGLLFMFLQTAIHLSREGVHCQQFTIRNITSVFGADNCVYVPQADEDDAISRIALIYYYGPTTKSFIEVPLNQSATLLDHPSFNLSFCMVVHMFGWSEGVNGRSVKNITQAYLDRGSCNFVLVDWDSVTQNMNYFIAAAMVPSSSKEIARALDEMIDAGAGLCHISGFSLGGQAIGHVARNMRNRVSHLVALDPAGPLFYQPVECVTPISDKDADCVEVLHTDRGEFGAPVRTGTVDHWMNGGIKPQPGCSAAICSHPRALFYWIEVLKNPSLFVSRQCSSWVSFLLNFCSGNNVTNIGQCNKDTIPGNYFLRTLGRRPFGIGPSGSSPAFIAPDLSIVDKVKSIITSLTYSSTPLEDPK